MAKFAQRLLLSATMLVILGGSETPVARAQSRPSDKIFTSKQVVAGISVSRARCAEFERNRTAIWVDTKSGGACMRYYAAGLAEKGSNPVAAVWMPGDVMGGPNGVRHQDGIGTRYMVEHMRALSGRYHVPFIFVARPGSYGSSGKNYTIRHTPIEPEEIGVELDSLKRLYRVDFWSLGGHSGGGTLVAELLARRTDIRCAVISSGAAAYRARLVERGFQHRLQTEKFFDPYDSIQDIPNNPARKIIVIGDPRDRNIPFTTQRLYFEALQHRGLTAWLLPLRKGMSPEYHDLMDFGEAATGMCAAGKTQQEIEAALRAMPEQKDRSSN